MTETATTPGAIPDTTKRNGNAATVGNSDNSLYSAFWQHPTMIGMADAFLLGWKITEFRCRLQIAAALTNELQATSSGVDSSTDPARLELGDPIWMAGFWRALFKQITTTHAKEFPDASTRDTLYEPPGGDWGMELPYLYPAGDADNAYVEIGLSAHDPDGDKIVQEFSIYEVTRRSINALAVLYAESADCLIADTICGYQQALLRAMGLITIQVVPDGAAQGSQTVPASSGGAAPAAAASSGGAAQTGTEGGVPVLQTVSPAEHEKARREGVAALSTTLEQLLDSWSGFLHEQYQAESTSSSTTTRLQAFEAGRTLALLTWSISASTIAIEISGDPDTSELLGEWRKVFSPYNVVEAQHFVSALGGAMDCVYHQIAGTLPMVATATSVDTASYDPDLPSNVCRAITHCLDHWQAAIAWLTTSQNPQAPTFYKQLRVALIEQSNIWFSLLMGRQHLNAFTVESVMNRLVQNVLSQLESEFETAGAKATADEARQEIGGMIRALGPVAVLVGGAAAILVLLVTVSIVMAILQPGGLSANGLWGVLGIGGLGTVIAALFGVRGATGATQGTPGPAGAISGASNTSGASIVLERVGDLIQTVEASARESFKAAYAQLRRELASLNFSIGVTYPLIECFVIFDDTDDLSKVQDDYTFMTEVIWTRVERREEVEDIVRAALGPVGLLSGALIRNKKNSESDPAPLPATPGL